MSGFGGIRLGSGLRGRRVGVVDARGGRWCVLVGEVGDRPKVVASEVFEASDVAGVASMLERERVERVVRAAPGWRTIVRVVELPAGTEEEVWEAASLMAEAQLAAVDEAWRRGWGESPLGSSEGQRGVMIVGWLGDAGDAVFDEEETWTSEVVGAAWLASLGEDGVAVSGDSSSGGLVIAARAGGHGIVRTVREAGDDPGAWRRAVLGACEEMGVGLGDGDVGACFVSVDGEARRVIGAMGGQVDRTWMGRFGIALGVLEGLSRAGVGSSALFDMRATRPERRVGVLERGSAWLSGVGRAMVVLAACLALMVGVPLGVAMARDAVLGERVAVVEEATGGGAAELQTRASFYTALEGRRWPMTKLLSDISRAMPVGVSAESVTMAVGEEIVVRGKAEAAKQVDVFTSTLRESGVFESGAPDVRRSGEGYEFDVRLRVVRPFEEGKNLESFADRTLGIRLYGEAYSEVEAAEAAKAAEREAERERRAASRRGGDEGGGRIFDGSDERETPPEPVPEALTDEQIAAMDRATLVKEFAARSRASSRRDIDDATKARLKDEVAKFRARLQELKGGG